MQECRIAWNPALLRDEIHGRKLAQHSTPVGSVPVDLLLMRPGNHHNLPSNLRACIVAPSPVWIAKLGPVLAAAPLERDRISCQGVHAHIVEIGAYAVRRGDLRHRAMERRVPRLVLSWMTRPAGVRRDVAVF